MLLISSGTRREQNTSLKRLAANSKGDQSLGPKPPTPIPPPTSPPSGVLTCISPQVKRLEAPPKPAPSLPTQVWACTTPQGRRLGPMALPPGHAPHKCGSIYRMHTVGF